MFVPLPSDNVCDTTSPTAIAIAQMVSRTWQNFRPDRRDQVPESITYHSDGTGYISVSYDIFTSGVTKGEEYTHAFTWKLARSGPLGMEDIHYGALFNTFPKLERSTTAWTYRTWEEGMVPAYIYLDLVGKCSFESDPSPPLLDAFIPASSQGLVLPLELLDHILELASQSSDNATALRMASTSRRARELCLRNRRRQSFKDVARRYGKYGMAMWMTCGHYNPTSSRSPSALYGIKAATFKFPHACGYSVPVESDDDWRKGWNPHQLYYSCRLPMPIRDTTMFWQRVMGERSYDAHPEVAKKWTTC